MPSRAQYFTVLLLPPFVVLTCFSGTLFNYFQSDDFILLATDKHWLEHFTSCWWQTFSTTWLANPHHSLYYRPLHPLAYALELLISNGQPLLYHIVNIALLIATTFVLFLLTKTLFARFLPGREKEAALACSCIFAAYPLHTESVAWISGRIDLICMFLIISCIYLAFSQPQTKKRLALAFGTYILAQLFKETAAVVPPLVMSGCLLLDGDGEKERRQKILKALKISAPYWIFLFLFLSVRATVLGTWSGGYTGSFAILEKKSLIYWLTNIPGWLRIILPLPPGSEILWMMAKMILIGIYIAITFIVFFKIKKIPARQLTALLLIWTLIAILPSLNTWYLTDHLIGGRLFNVGSAFFCALLTLTIYQCPFPRFTVSIITLIFAAASIYFSQVWHQASDISHNIKADIETKISGLHPGQKLVFLNPPRNSPAIYLFPHYWDLKNILVPPFNSQDRSEKLVSIDHVMFGSPLINADQLRRLIDESNSYIFTYWDSATSTMLDYKSDGIKAARESLPLYINQIKSRQKDDNFLSCNANLGRSLPAVAIDQIEIKMVCPPHHRSDVFFIKPTITLCLNSPDNDAISLSKAEVSGEALTEPVENDGEIHTYTFPVSQYKSWVLQPQLKSISFLIKRSACTDVTLLSVALKNTEATKPILSPDAATLCLHNDGSYALRDKGNARTLFYDCSTIPDCKNIRLEISQPDCWFDMAPRDFRDTTYGDRVRDSKIIEGKKGKIELDRSILPSDRYYDVRIAALDSKGNIIGYFSDPVTLYIE